MRSKHIWDDEPHEVSISAPPPKKINFVLNPSFCPKFPAMHPRGLFLDDERLPEDVTWVRLEDAPYAVVRTYDEFVAYVEEHGIPEFISFDNDLGCRGGEGRNCAKWLVEAVLDGRAHFPSDFRFTVHSKNPVAAEWIEQYLGNFLRVHRNHAVPVRARTDERATASEWASASDLLTTKVSKFKLTWFIPPREAYLPTIAVTVLGESTLAVEAAIGGWKLCWEEKLGIASRDVEQRRLDRVAHGRAHLFIALADQTPDTLIYTQEKIGLSDELGFDRIIIAATGDVLTPLAAEVTAPCAITTYGAAPSHLLHALRLLLAPERLIGYDNADVFSILSGRVGHVVDLEASAVPQAQVSHRRVQGCTLIVRSTSLREADAIAVRLRRSIGIEDMLWCIEDEGLPSEVGILTSRRPCQSLLPDDALK